jgi:hypothetical protein
MKRTPEERTAKKVFKNIPEGKCSVGEPRNGWLDYVKNDQKKTGVMGLQKKIATDGEACKLILKKTRVLHGPKSQRGRIIIMHTPIQTRG